MKFDEMMKSDKIEELVPIPPGKYPCKIKRDRLGDFYVIVRGMRITLFRPRLSS